VRKPPGNISFTEVVYHSHMVRVRTTAAVEADLAALRAAAERAGSALACLFSSSDEYEADIIRERRAQGAYGPQRRSSGLVRFAIATALLALAFLIL
jgi:hypothetical protein